MRSACDSERPTTVTHGQSWSLDGCRHDSAKSAFALFRALETSPRLVVRDRIELSTFRFSVLRMIVHSCPSRFICLIQNLRRPLAYFPARTRMRQELRPRASPWPRCLASAQRHRTRPPCLQSGSWAASSAAPTGRRQAPRPAPAQPTWQRIRLGRIRRPGSLADCADETHGARRETALGAPGPAQTRPISGVPPAAAVACLAAHGVTHVVNCRPRVGVWWARGSGGRAGRCRPRRVAHAPMHDHGLRKRPTVWTAAACFAARVLDDLPRRACSSPAPPPGAARSWSATRCCGCAGTTAPPRRRWRWATGAGPTGPAYVRSAGRWLAAAAR